MMHRGRTVVIMRVESNINDVAQDVSQCLAEGDEASAIRVAFRFVERYDKSDWLSREAMTRNSPESTGNRRFDALLAAVVEFSCASHRSLLPTWLERSEGFLEEFWFVARVSALHAEALVHSPISFARRGIFISQDALTHA
jgi:hypothetical protein